MEATAQPAQQHPAVQSSAAASAAHTLLRRRLLAAVAPPARLVTVRAPAGWGKTTLLAQICAQREAGGSATAWLGLDRDDEDAPCFLARLGAAVDRLCPQDEGGSAAAQDGAPPPPGDVLLALIERLAARRTPFALFIDDFDRAAAPANRALLAQIAAELPRSGQMFIAADEGAAAALAELDELVTPGASAECVRIDAAALAFTREEAHELFTGLAPADPAHGTALVGKSGGCVQALALAATALADTALTPAQIGALPETLPALLQALVEALLAQQPQRDLLLRLSALGEVDAALCAAVCECRDSAAALTALAAVGWLAPVVDGKGGRRYRVPALLRSALAQSAALRFAGGAALQATAARWLERAGRRVEAMEQALASGDQALCLDLFAAQAEDLLGQGRLRLLRRWFAALPASALASRPLLPAVQLWALCLDSEAGAALRLLAGAPAPDSAAAQVAAHRSAVQPLALAMLDRHAEALEAGREAVAHLPSASAYADDALVSVMAQMFAAAGQLHAARQLLDAARRRQGHQASLLNMMYSESLEGSLDLQEARLRQASARFSMAVSASAATSHGHSGGNAWAALLHASTLYESGATAATERLLKLYLPGLEAVGLPDHLIIAHRLLARLASDAGAPERALQLLAALARAGERRQLPRLVASAHLERARLLLLRGLAPEAEAELERANGAAPWKQLERLRLLANDLDYPEMQRLRWAASVGDAGAAIAQFEREIARAIGSSRHCRALKLRVLKSVAYERSGARQVAVDLIGQVLRSASSEGFLRLLIDEGEQVGALVRQFASNWRGNSGTQRDPIFAEYLQRLLFAFARARPAGATP